MKPSLRTSDELGWRRRDGHAATSERSPSRHKSFSARNGLTIEHVTTGGSFLCNLNYCESYRPTARRGTPYDTGSEHVGFRCAKSAEGGKS